MNREIEAGIKRRIGNLKMLLSEAIRRRDQGEIVALSRDLSKANEQRRVGSVIVRLEAAILKAMATGDEGQASRFRAQLANTRTALAQSLGIPVRALQE